MNKQKVAAEVVGSSAEFNRYGHDALWDWFGLSYASWLTLPRSLMHQMPDEWQGRMAALLREWNETFDSSELPGTRVQAVTASGKLTSFPGWVLNYRHPCVEAINALRLNPKLTGA